MFSLHLVDISKGYVDPNNNYSNQSIYGWLCIQVKTTVQMKKFSFYFPFQELDIQLSHFHAIYDNMLTCVDGGPPHFYHNMEYGWGFFTQLPKEVPPWKAVLKPYDEYGWLAVLIAATTSMITLGVMNRKVEITGILSWVMVTLTGKGDILPRPKAYALSVLMVTWTLMAAPRRGGYQLCLQFKSDRGIHCHRVRAGAGDVSRHIGYGLQH